MGSRNPIWQWPNETIWRKYCGFLDLTKEEFREIQRELLQDELLLVHRSPLGQSLLPGSLPKNTADFRQSCRLTTYQDYRPFLESHQESSLAEPAYRWADSEVSGRENRATGTSQAATHGLRGVLDGESCNHAEGGARSTWILSQ